MLRSRSEERREEFLELYDARPRTAARRLGITRRQARELIRMERGWPFGVDLYVIAPGGVSMTVLTYEALVKLKGPEWVDRATGNGDG